MARKKKKTGADICAIEDRAADIFATRLLCDNGKLDLGGRPRGAIMFSDNYFLSQAFASDRPATITALGHFRIVASLCVRSVVSFSNQLSRFTKLKYVAFENISPNAIQTRC